MIRTISLLHVLAGIAVATIVGACTSTGTLYGPPADTIFGVAGCTDKTELCNVLSGNTINFWGPRRYDYLAPDGTAYHWQGNNLAKGKWYMRGRAFCLAVPESSPPRCQGRGQLVGDVDSVLVGDPFGLSKRSSAPTKTVFGRGDSDEKYLRQAGVDPTTVTIFKGLPR